MQTIYVLWEDDALSVVGPDGSSADNIVCEDAGDIRWIPGRRTTDEAGNEVIGSTGQFKIINIDGLPNPEFSAQHWVQENRVTQDGIYSYTIVAEDKHGNQRALDPQIENKSSGGPRYGPTGSRRSGRG